MLTIIFFFALGVRLFGLALTPQQPTYGDETEYMELAQVLTEDHTYPTRPYRPPGYPAFIAAVWSIGPDTYAFLRIVQACVGALTIVLVFLVAGSVFDERVAVGASLLMSIYPLWVYTSTTAYPQVIACALFYLILLLALRSEARLSLEYSASIGVLTGIAVLCIPAYVVLLPALLAWLVCVRQPRELRKAIRFWGVCTLAAITVVAPWSIRNWIANHEVIPVATNGPINFWLGNNPWATLNTKSHLHPFAIYGARLERLSPQEQDRFLIKMATQYIQAHPLRTFGFTVAKFFAFFRPWPGQITGSDMPGRAVLLWLDGIIWIVVMVFGILGFVLLRHQYSQIWLWALVIVFLAFLYSLFFPAMRFRTPVDAMFGMLAIAAVYHMIGLIRN